MIAIKLQEEVLRFAWGSNLLCESIIILLDYGHWLDSWWSMKHRNICIAISFHYVEKNRLQYVVFQHRFAQEWMRPVVFHVSRVCLAFLFFLFFLLGRSLSKQLPSLPALSLHQNRPPPISSCEKAQFCLSLPKRKHIMKCKPVAPPEMTGLLIDCSVVTILVINTLSPPRKVKKKKDKKSWMKMFARHNCCIHIA